MSWSKLALTRRHRHPDLELFGWNLDKTSIRRSSINCNYQTAGSHETVIKIISARCGTFSHTAINRTKWIPGFKKHTRTEQEGRQYKENRRKGQTARQRHRRGIGEAAARQRIQDACQKNNAASCYGRENTLSLIIHFYPPNKTSAQKYYSLFHKCQASPETLRLDSEPDPEI